MTRSSFAGIHLFESQAAVEAIYGHGHPVKRHEPGLIDYAAGFTVGYQKLPRLARGVAIVYTTSRRFRTAEGVGVGSTLAAVEGFGHMDCGPTTTTQAECQTIAHGPGLFFDLVHGRVTRLGLVWRTN